jgi:hypothetical protein
MAEAYPGIATNEQWLFRQGELVLGPVNREQLVQKLYAGEITAQTPVTRMGENAFRPLSAVDGFGLHIAKAEAKLRVEAKSRSDQQASRRKKTVILSVVAGVAVVIAVGAAIGARYLAVHNPWADSDALAFADISMDPPTITLAKAEAADEELLAYPLEPGATGHRSERTRRSERSSARTSAKAEHSAAPVPAKATTDSEGLQIAQADQGAINEVVVAHKKSLYPCLIAEARRKPGLAARIPIEFVVGNDGKVSKLWVDNPDFKDGPLPDCMLKTLKTWPFKPYAGAGASVRLSFTIGKRGG